MKVEKSYEITDAKISFVSLVDKAANKKQFLITKAEKGQANFTTYGRILKVDSEHHYITGIVYEPLVEDAHGNFMTEEEIIKAAYWFAKNGDKVDLQHSFEELSDAVVVENWVTKSDSTIEGQEIKKGTWLLTVEISDADVWDKVQKGEISGFSMGGVGKYSNEDVDLDSVEKGDGKMNADTTEKKGIFKKLAEALGFEVVEKGAFTDNYNAKKKASLFWNAWYTLENLLYKWDWYSDKGVFESDEDKIREALSEFTEIVTDILTEDSVTKSLALEEKSDVIQKAGKKMSANNKLKLDEITQALSDFAKGFDENEEEEESEVKKEDIQKMIDEAVKKAVEAKPAGVEKQEELTTEVVEKMIADSISKALETGKEEVKEEVKKEALTADAIQEMITKAMEPILKGRGLPNNLNADGKPIQKEDNHYLEGIL